VSYLHPTGRLRCGHRGVYWRREGGGPALGPVDGGRTVHCHNCGRQYDRSILLSTARCIEIRRHNRNVCLCHSRCPWVVYNVYDNLIINHFKTRAEARAVAKLARAAFEAGYSIHTRPGFPPESEYPPGTFFRTRG
jgi:hypothetical protein